MRKKDPVYAREKLLHALKTTGSISKTAHLCGTTRPTVRRVKRRYEAEGKEGLSDRSRKPKNSPKRTPLHIEALTISFAKKTCYGIDRISRILTERGILVKPSTVRYVLKRYNISAKYKRTKYQKNKDTMNSTPSILSSILRWI